MIPRWDYHRGRTPRFPGGPEASRPTQHWSAKPSHSDSYDEAAARFGDKSVNTYIESLAIGDPLADAFAADCAEMGIGKGMKLLSRWLAGEGLETLDAPDSLRALAAQVDCVPDYVDFAQIDRGAAAFCRHAREAALALSTASLVSGYDNPAASAPLIVTGRFTEMAPVRAIETSVWIFTVARPGGLRRESVGFARTIRVRMIHAFVRRHILSSGDWDTANLGVPINQADLAYTVIEFLWLPVRSMEQMGVYYTSEDREAIFAMWRYMGYLVGVQERILATDGSAAQRFEDMQMFMSNKPDKDCRELVRALLNDVMADDIGQAQGALGIVGRRYGRQIIHGLARAFCGDRIANNLGVDDTVWKYVPKLTYPFINVSDRIRYKVPGANKKAMARKLNEIDTLLAVNAKARGMKHDLVDHAAQSAPSDHHPAAA